MQEVPYGHRGGSTDTGDRHADGTRTAPAVVGGDSIDVYDDYWSGRNKQYDLDMDALKNIPSAQPEPLTEEEMRLLKKLRSFHNGSYAKLLDKLVASAQPEPQWIPCSECMYWRDERVLMNNGKARQYNGDEPDALGIKHSVPIEVGINQGAMCLYEEGRGWSTDHTTFRNADDFCSRFKKRPCSYEEWYGIVDGVYAEPWRGEEHG